MRGLVGPAALIAGTVGTGLIAGLFFAFSTAIMPGLRRADDQVFVTSMQGINEAILNPVFLTTFMAPIICLGVAAFTGPARAWVIAALVLYVVAFLITMAGNVPLNDALAAVGTTHDASALEAARKAFEDPWNRLHLVRTLAVIASLGCCIGALRA